MPCFRHCLQGCVVFIEICLENKECGGKYYRNYKRRDDTGRTPSIDRARCDSKYEKYQRYYELLLVNILFLLYVYIVTYL